MKIKSFTKKSIFQGIGAFGLMFSTCLSAAPLGLSTSPLVVAQSVDPNIMILFDTSGSMQEPVIGDPYNAAANYDAGCSGSYVADWSEMEWRIDGSGVAQFYDPDHESEGGWVSTGPEWWEREWVTTYFYFYWGTSGDSDVYKCFDPSQDYEIQLLDEWFGVEDTYDGDILNWYFSNIDQTGPAYFGFGVNKKPEAKSRNEVARQAILDLIGPVGGADSLTGIRMGIAGFKASGTDTARMYSGLADLDVDADRNTLLGLVDSMPNSGGTPLTASLAAVGSYFIAAHGEESLDTDGDGTGDIDAEDLFDNPPDYSTNSVPTPTPNSVIQYSCQKNFVIAMTDGVPTGDADYHDDLAEWVDDEVNHSDALTGDFDDVAAAMYDLDLRPDTFPRDHNNIVTYPIGFAIDLPLLSRAADLAGGTYYTPEDSDQLNAALRSIVTNVQGQISTVASVAFNSGQLVDGSSVFQAKFNTSGYTGSLLSYVLDAAGEIDLTETWEAGEELDALGSYADRKIFTMGATDGVEFAWANLTATQKADLSYPGADATYGEQVLNFIAGSHADETVGNVPGLFRERFSRLGDIVNSTPVFVGAPELNWPSYAQDSRFGSSSLSYSTYKNSTAAVNRTPVVYVGANDGMLHGFNGNVVDTSGNPISGGGSEIFAYIPGAVYSSSSATSGLHYLASESYDHRFYVDLTPSISDVFIPSVDAGTAAWRTVLIGGLRAGGKGLFALDVTNPALFADPANNADDVVLWEFTDSDDADLGFTYSQPSIVMMPDETGSHNGRWAAVFGNGYNSASEKAVLFIVFLDGGLDGTWTENTDYIKIEVDAGPSNGLSTPRVVDMDGDSVADRIYAGDLQGNMWVFDVSSTTATDWHDSANTTKLFTANSGVVQPITSAPILVKNTAYPSGSAPNVLVMFGTGKFLEPTDADSNTNLMSYYGVWDNGSANLARGDLQVRQILTNTYTYPDPDPESPDGSTIDVALRSITGDPVAWADGGGTNDDYGWYMDLENKATSGGTAVQVGERVVTDSLIRREVLLFNTIIPDDVACSAGGTGWLMSVDYLTGKAPAFAVFDADKDGDIGTDNSGAIDGSDLGFVGEQFVEGLPSKSGVLGSKQYTPGSAGTIEDREIEVGGGALEGRLSWEELYRN